MQTAELRSPTALKHMITARHRVALVQFDAPPFTDIARKQEA